MKTAHKRASEHMTPDYINQEALMNAYADLYDRLLIHNESFRRQRLLNLGERAAREVVEDVLKERLRLAELPYRSAKQQSDRQ